MARSGDSHGSTMSSACSSATPLPGAPSIGVTVVPAPNAAGWHLAQSAVTWAVTAPAGSLRVEEPRLSTTYDDEGRQRRAGLELWVGGDDAYPRRASGEAVCGAEVDLGRLRLECAFFNWRMDGRPGVGRYDILRRA